MSMFAHVTVSNEIALPHFPSKHIDRSELVWQSKQGIDRYDGPYRITTDGRLEKEESYYREKTDEEKQESAEQWGFDSWDAFVDAYESYDGDDLYPDSVEYDPDEDDEFPPMFPRENVLAYTEWNDINKHGTMEFHSVFRRDPMGTRDVGGVEMDDDHKLDVYLEYEARFTDGDLDEIIFMGERFSDEPIESAKQEIQEWVSWKEQQQSTEDDT